MKLRMRLCTRRVAGSVSLRALLLLPVQCVVGRGKVGMRDLKVPQGLSFLHQVRGR